MNARLFTECAGRAWLMRRENLAGLLRAVRSDSPLMKAQQSFASGRTRSGSVALIPISGVIMPFPSFFLELFGGTSVEGFRKSFREALADDSVSGILLKIDSPGGTVDMVASMADEIFAARGRKPITAYTETMAASAAYWLGTQADQFFAARDAEVGSIGCYLTHIDMSRSLDSEGLTVTLISAGEHKVDGNEFEPLPGDVRAQMQARVNEVAADFTAAVARGRGVSKAVVSQTFGQGLMFTGPKAAALKMIDRVATLDAVVATVASGRRSGIGAQLSGGVDWRDADARQAEADADHMDTTLTILKYL